MFSNRYIISLSPEFQKAAIQEMGERCGEARLVTAFKDGLYLIETERPFVAQGTPPVFVRHVMPVQAALALSGQPENDLPLILEQARCLVSLSVDEPFAVQCRMTSPNCGYRSKDVEVYVGEYFHGQGADPVFSDWFAADGALPALHDQQVISIFVYYDQGYLGVSRAGENLVDHPDRHRMVTRQGGCVINRAEFKLIEAMHTFSVHPGPGLALDLGAAPGGWTYVLAERGMDVLALDPADLDPRVAAHPRVRHMRLKAEDFAAELGCQNCGPVALVVNDLGVEPQESVWIMSQIAPLLPPGCPVIMTAKCFYFDPRKQLEKILPKLGEHFHVRQVKNLFYNRREVTLLLEKR